MELVKQIRAYQPYNEQEEHDKQVILQQIAAAPDIFLRENKLAHMTASAWVVNTRLDKLLMVWHLLYHSWSWMGGHADGETDLLAVAMREVCEESGIHSVRPLSDEIFSLEVLTVDGHEKHGQYVSSHLHLNITYLLQAEEADVLHIKSDENKDVAWFGLDEAVDASNEAWFRERIYAKLNRKLALFHSKN